MKEWLKKRSEFTHERLLNELRTSEPSDFKNFLRLDAESFDELLRLVEPRIKKVDTTMRDAISVSERLSITLRYLASGNSFEDLKFTSAISAQAIGRIVVETCSAIIHCLKDYIQVRSIIFLFKAETLLRKTLTLKIIPKLISQLFFI